MGVTGVHDFLTKKAASRPATLGKMSSDKGQLRIKGGVSLSNFHRRPANGENYSRKFLQKRSVGGNYSEKFLQKRSVGGIYSRKFLQKRSVGGNYSRKRLQKRSVGGIYSGERLQRDRLEELTRGNAFKRDLAGGMWRQDTPFLALMWGKGAKEHQGAREAGLMGRVPGPYPEPLLIRSVCGGGRGRRAWPRSRGGR